MVTIDNLFLYFMIGIGIFTILISLGIAIWLFAELFRGEKK